MTADCHLFFLLTRYVLVSQYQLLRAVKHLQTLVAKILGEYLLHCLSKTSLDAASLICTRHRDQKSVAGSPHSFPSLRVGCLQNLPYAYSTASPPPAQLQPHHCLD